MGKRVDRKTTRQLAKKYAALKRRDPYRAAQFLKLLRYEMEQYRHFTGKSRRRLGSNSRTIKRWVKRYIKRWYREADENLYRAYAKQLTRVDD